MSLPSVSAVVVTLDRPKHVVRCIEHLLGQTTAPSEIIVIDSSVGNDTERLVLERFPSVTFRRTAAGLGATAAARNLGFGLASGEVVAFVDDDAYAEPDWLEHLLEPYGDPTVGGVGGRQIRHQPDELTEGVDAIGRLLPDGTITGNFAADPGGNVDVDHLLGANMSFRRQVIDEIGGIRDGYFGTCLREETDLCLRVANGGYRLVFTPDAVVEHVAATYAKGRRFDLRYTYWAQKNHLILLIRNFGLHDRKVRGFLRTTSRTVLGETGQQVRRGGTRLAGRDAGGAVRSIGAAGSRAAVTAAGTVTGLATGVHMARLDRLGITVSRHRSRR